MRGGAFADIKSVIDVGCGVGTWLKAWQDLESEIKIFGIDGNNVDDKLFYISKEYYRRVDLRGNADDIFREVCQNLSLPQNNKPFSLAQSVEVAEHLEEEYAKNFVHLLTQFSDIVLFSAAIPYQGGTDHFNEQPPKYWADLFWEFDYVCFDILRQEIWENEKIGFWYRQNLLLYVHKDKAHLLESLGFRARTPLYLVRPEYVEYYAKCYIEKIQENPIKLYWRHPTRMFKDIGRFICS